MSEPFDEWAIVEVMGHQRCAGRVSEQTIGGSAFVRVDVPDAGNGIAFTKLYGPGSIYCITPCSEAVARGLASTSPGDRELSRLDFNAKTRQELDAGRRVIAAKALPTMPVDGDPGEISGSEFDCDDYSSDHDGEDF